MNHNDQSSKYICDNLFRFHIWLKMQATSVFATSTHKYEGLREGFYSSHPERLNELLNMKRGTGGINKERLKDFFHLCWIIVIFSPLNIRFPDWTLNRIWETIEMSCDGSCNLKFFLYACCMECINSQILTKNTFSWILKCVRVLFFSNIPLSKLGLLTIDQWTIHRSNH